MKPLDFIQIVAEELSISEEESQKLLAEFTTHLNNELNNTNAVQLPGLGILKKDASAFSLELDPSFAIEINFKYAGMQPILYRMILMWVLRKRKSPMLKMWVLKVQKRNMK